MRQTQQNAQRSAQNSEPIGNDLWELLTDIFRHDGDEDETAKPEVEPAGGEETEGSSADGGPWTLVAEGGLVGASGDEHVSGGAGDDDLEGGDGDDTLDGGEGDDTLYGGEGDDQLLGGADNDTVDYTGAGDVMVYLTWWGGDGFALGDHGSDIIVDVENITTGSGNDTLVGDEGDNVLISNDGHDVVYGIEGDDTIILGHGNDTAFGGDGRDTLEGGTGYNELTGGAGADEFRLVTPWNQFDVITDFIIGIDHLVFDGVLEMAPIDITQEFAGPGDPWAVLGIDSPAGFEEIVKLNGITRAEAAAALESGALFTPYEAPEPFDGGLKWPKRAEVDPEFIGWTAETPDHEVQSGYMDYVISGLS
ncbi:MAG: calcium-binding protein [Pseudomonadota bacterium]